MNKNQYQLPESLQFDEQYGCKAKLSSCSKRREKLALQEWHHPWTQNKNWWHFLYRTLKFVLQSEVFYADSLKPLPPNTVLCQELFFSLSLKAGHWDLAKPFSLLYKVYVLAMEYSFHFTLLSICVDVLKLLLVDLVDVQKNEEEARPHTLKEYGFTFPDRHFLFA